MPLPVIDLAPWRFIFSNSSPLRDLADTSGPDTILNFDTATDLYRHVADDDQDEFIRIQDANDSRIRRHPVVKDYLARRTPLKDLPHFRAYRHNRSDRYHAAARARAAGTATLKDDRLFNGLYGEIDASQIIVPAGQVVFHGRAQRDLAGPPPYPTFISTSLEPIVAHQSARRIGIGQKSGRPVVYVLTLHDDLPALWGHVGRSHEWELLLPAGLNLHEVAFHPATRFDVIEASVGR